VPCQADAARSGVLANSGQHGGETVISTHEDQFGITRCWRRRSSRFIWAGRAFFLSAGAGLLYAGFRAMSFLPALRDAQFQTDAVRRAEGVEAYAAAWRNVAATWGERVAQYPVSLFEWLGFFSVFVIVAVLLWLYRDHPQGKPIVLKDPEVRRRFAAALALHGRPVHLYERTDNQFDAAGGGHRVYLPATLIDRLMRKRNDNAIQQLLFVLEHEALHHDALDNVFVAIGRSIVLVATAIIAVFTTNFIIAGFAFLFPTPWICVTGDIGTIIFVFAAVVLYLFATAALVNGFNATFYGVREFFADVIPAEHIKRAEILYAHTDDPDQRGTALAAWSLLPPPPDRVEHILGVTPRVAALAAFATALWVTLRMLILVVDPVSATGPIWGFDLIAVVPLGVMLAQLPRRAKGRIDYGLIPWMATFSVIGPLIAAAWGLDYAAQHFIKFGALNRLWLAAVTVPPVLVTVAFALYTLIPANGAVPPSLPPFHRPRRPQLRRLSLWLFALPSIIASYLIATYALYLLGALVTKVSAALVGTSTWSVIYAVDLAGAAVAALLLSLILRNLSTTSAGTAWSEAVLDCFVVGLAATVFTLIYQAQLSAVQSQRAFGMEVLTEVLSSSWPALATLLLVATSVTAVVLVPSWWARVRVSIPNNHAGDPRR
jgi:hypothetical protein